MFFTHVKLSLIFNYHDYVHKIIRWNIAYNYITSYCYGRGFKLSGRRMASTSSCRRGQSQKFNLDLRSQQKNKQTKNIKTAALTDHKTDYF